MLYTQNRALRRSKRRARIEKGALEVDPSMLILPQRSEQTATFSRDLRKFLVGGLLDLITDRKMKPIKGRRLHLVEFLAQMPGGIIDLSILKSPQGDL